IKNTAANEQCDDGNKNGTAASPNNCNAFCKTNACGNGIEDLNEQCDPGGGASPADTSTCDFDCTLPMCGDGHTNLAVETCDQGTANGDPCAYNDPLCTRCNSTCTGNVNPGGPFCGDGLKQTAFSEACDPGGGFPALDALICDNDCTPAVCGDRHVNLVALETCDDGNSLACGTCGLNCLGGPVTPGNATGSIKTAAAVAGQGNIKDGDTITLDDGFHTATVFEFDVGGGGVVGPGNIKISLVGDGSENAAAVATKLRAAILAQSTLDLGAVISGGDTVQLTNTHSSAFGNKNIGHTGNIDASFTFVNLTGGAAGDCNVGTGCKANADCSSNNCNATTHVCQ
ncbi:MAG TPA: hypothetical protein VK601_02715, partial [Kofleriaceae bacterium]|nr:hypothetical protein [Kofleriaceae bacterium]